MDGSVSDGAGIRAFLGLEAREEVAARLRSKPSSKLICAQVGLRCKSDCGWAASEEDASDAAVVESVGFVPCMLCTNLLL